MKNVLKKLCIENITKNKENEHIIKELYINVFPGFYESIFCNSDQFIDFESEDKYILLDKYPFLNI